MNHHPSHRCRQRDEVLPARWRLLAVVVMFGLGVAWVAL